MEPTSYYVRSAMAWRDNRNDDASQWQRKAEEEFSPATNKLYAESFYEIGWYQRPTGTEREDINIVSSAERSERVQTDAQATLAQAESAFLAHQSELALALLDDVDTRFPGLAASHNLRGEILLEENQLDEAETELCEAVSADPNQHEQPTTWRKSLSKKRLRRSARQVRAAFCRHARRRQSGRAADEIQGLSSPFFSKVKMTTPSSS